MNNQMYQYLRELHIFIERQTKKIYMLEKSMNELRQEIASLKERPPVQIGTLEYKFDQLKVETLEGTLNIGLNPTDLEGISDFSVDNKSMQSPIPPKTPFKIVRNNEIESEIMEFLEISLPQIYEQAQDELKFTVSDSYYPLIKEDIIKQLPQRISSHLASLPADQRNLDKAAKQEITNKIKHEIQQGVRLFLSQLQQQEREGKT
ncbi:spore germination protein GerPC [Bacillus sp. FJAT-27251]|uniref:spore germination protein GerPC n=1 Tax=Bacillus sp. FJAT-27251 TaxID=1684142 RepID=UPI0006A75F65|nr:spore germination protein GerPC [Bacillus sp. FJAT-27251]